MIDAHIHLDQYDEKQLPVLIEQWQKNGIRSVIAVSTSLQSSYDTLLLQEKYPNFVHAAIGFHPEYPLPHPADLYEWKRLVQLERNAIVAIGEIGLPYYSLQKEGLQKEHIEFFCTCVEIAVMYNKPVILHAVYEQAEIALQIIQKKGVKTAHFHWLKATNTIVEQIVKASYYISVTPEVVYRRRDQQLIKNIPLSQLLIETDGPWSFSGPFENKKTTPLFLKDIIDTISHIKNISASDLKRQLRHNSRTLFCI